VILVNVDTVVTFTLPVAIARELRDHIANYGIYSDSLDELRRALSTALDLTTP
jgi:hypothetical protein